MGNVNRKSRTNSKATPFIWGVDPYLLIQPLIEEDVITREEWQQIEKENDTKRRKCQELYKYLKRSPHPRAFVIVKETLEKLGKEPSISNEGVIEHLTVHNDQVQQNIIASLQERVEKLENERDDAVGHLMEQKHDFEASEALQQPAALKSIGCIHLSIGTDIFGVVKLNENIFVLCRNPIDECIREYKHTIRVFEDGNEFSLVKEIFLDGVTDGHKLTCCENLNCLYFYDSHEKYIWIIRFIDLTMDQYEFHKWLKIADSFIKISVSRNDHLCVFYYDISPAKLEIYDGTNATLLQSIEFPENIGKIDFVTEYRNGQFIIFHRLGDSKESYVISQLTNSMEIIRQFKPLGSQKLDTFCNLFLDSKKNRLIVVDVMKQRVDLIDADYFKFVQGFLIPKDLDLHPRVPYPLCYDETKNQLIACFHGEEIKIFQLG